eukprot:4703711-Pleurochrysis_carterae.AAC.2
MPAARLHLSQLAATRSRKRITKQLANRDTTDNRRKFAYNSRIGKPENFAIVLGGGGINRTSPHCKQKDLWVLTERRKQHRHATAVATCDCWSGERRTARRARRRPAAPLPAKQRESERR